jgi:hypothetical protein
MSKIGVSLIKHTNVRVVYLFIRNQNRLTTKVVDYGLGGKVSTSGQRIGIPLFITVHVMALWPTHTVFNGYRTCLRWKVKWHECKADHSHMPSAKVKNVWNFISTPSVCLHGICVEEQGKLYL